MNPEQITTRATIAELRAGKTPQRAKPKRAATSKHPKPTRSGSAAKKRGG